MATSIDMSITPITSKSERSDNRIYEEISNGTREEFDIEQNKSYDDAVKIKLPNDHPPAGTSKLSKLEKSLILLVAAMSILLVALSALVAVGYVEGSKLKKQQSKQEEEMGKVNTTIDMLDNDFEVYRHISDKNFDQLFNKANITLNDLNYVRYIEELTLTYTNATQQSVDDLTAKLVSDMQTLHVFESCAAVRSLSLPFNSGIYRLRSNNSITQLYCSMEFTCNSTALGWRRVAYFDISDTGTAQCPTGFLLETMPHSCAANFSGPGCASVVYPTDTSYSCVLGRINGYQLGTPDGFQRYSFNRPENATLDTNYVDGVSLTHGKPRNHIWTLAAGSSTTTPIDCKTCNTSRPSFVKMDYSCEINHFCPFDEACRTDQLWDSDQCIGDSIFFRQLPQPTTNDIEMRVCRDEDRGNEDVLFTSIEMYVQ